MTQTQTTATGPERHDAGPAVRAFTRLLRAHASTTRLLSAELLEEHGLTINDYEALLVLSRADGQRLKRVDISRQLLLTPSGITRLLEGLEALLVLSRADGQRLKRVDISRQLLLTPSGITRLLEGLEAEGLVERQACESDLRVTYARLTETGARRLQAASCAHVASITALFEEHLDEREITGLADTLDKLPGVAGTGGACSAS